MNAHSSARDLEMECAVVIAVLGERDSSLGERDGVMFFQLRMVVGVLPVGEQMVRCGHIYGPWPAIGLRTCRRVRRTWRSR